MRGRELFEELSSNAFPVQALFERKRDGVDHYSAGHSHDPRRFALHTRELVNEPLSNALLEPYVDARVPGELLEACDRHRYERLAAQFRAAWKGTLGAAFSIPAYFVRIGDDLGDVWDLRANRRIPRDEMYD